MSRFYDALTEAKRTRQDDSSPWKRGILDVEIPRVEPAVENTDPTDMERMQAVLNSIPAEATVPDAVEAATPDAEVALNRFSAIPTTVSLDRRARVIPHAIDGSIVEHYRRLRTKILEKREEKPFRTLLVTSANPQEGKTLTVLNLAFSFAMLPGFKVLVIDGDLRKGSLGRWLGAPADQLGLGDVVNGSAGLESAVLGAEGIPINFMVRGKSRVTDVHASQFDVHFRKLGEHFDMILVDSPPVNLLADVQLLAKASDAVLLVARSFVTNRQALEKAAQDLQQFNLIGTILNAGMTRSRSYNGYY